MRRDSPAHVEKVLKCHTDQRKHFVMDVARPGEDLGARFVIRSYADCCQDPQMLKWLDEAWANQKDGVVSVRSGERFRIDTVRYQPLV